VKENIKGKKQYTRKIRSANKTTQAKRKTERKTMETAAKQRMNSKAKKRYTPYYMELEDCLKLLDQPQRLLRPGPNITFKRIGSSKYRTITAHKE
jgi:hypothetical protein